MKIRPGSRSWRTGGGQQLTRRVSVAALRLVLTTLATHWNLADERACPAVSTLAAETDLDERTVRAALRALEAQGLIRAWIGRGRVGSSYLLHIGPIGLVPPQTGHGAPSRAPSQSPPEPPPPEGVDPATGELVERGHGAPGEGAPTRARGFGPVALDLRTRGSSSDSAPGSGTRRPAPRGSSPEGRGNRSGWACFRHKTWRRGCPDCPAPAPDYTAAARPGADAARRALAAAASSRGSAPDGSMSRLWGSLAETADRMTAGGNPNPSTRGGGGPTGEPGRPGGQA